MKNIVRILTVASAASLMLAGCQSNKLEQPMTEAHFVLAPTVYGAFDAPATRAVDLTKTGTVGHPDYYHNGFLGEPDKTLLPIGSTVWLTYRKAKVANPDTENPEHWGPIDLQAYVVQNAAGYNALYPIKSHSIFEDGITYLEVNDPPIYTQPLYLPDGKYQFRMVHPANRIVRDNLKMQVDNGMYVYSNDERYEQTQSKVIEIKNNDLGIQNIVLNPIIAQTVRFKVTVRPGKNVSKLEMMSQGIEVSGLQNPELEPDGRLMYKWSSMDIKDTLVMKKADKRARTYIREFTDNGDGSLTGAVGALPTNSMSTMTVILINAAVNGVPTQYAIALSQMKFFHGHSYNLDLQLDLDGNIHVMNWANQSWTGEVKLN